MFDTFTLEAAKARPLIKKTLKKGGFCIVTLGDQKRHITHNPMMDRPLTRLPWPLSLFQPHTITYSVLENDEEVYTKKYSRSEIGSAIEEFLEGVDASQNVIIMKGSSY